MGLIMGRIKPIALLIKGRNKGRLMGRLEGR
jgi:hypothetical protein